MTKKKAGMGMLLSALLLGGFVGTAKAANPATVTITVTVNSTLSLNVGTMTAINFGTISPGAVTVSSNAVVITNDSTGLVEDYEITMSTFIATQGGGPNWNVSGSTSPGTDVYALCAAINPAAMAAASFVSTDCQPATGSETAAQSYMSTSQFGNGGVEGANTNGAKVPDLATRNLWVYFAAPSQITDDAAIGQAESMTITLTAVAGTTF